VATEAQYKSTFNTSIVALEEAKGTLLEYKQIAVVVGPNKSGPSGRRPITRDSALARTAHEPPTVVSIPAQPGPVGPSPSHPDDPMAFPPTAASPKSAPAAKTVTFKFTVGIGSNPIEIRGSFTVTPVPPKGE
jgi:hypothetical protein